MNLDKIIQSFREVSEVFREITEHKGLPYETYYDQLLGGKISVHDALLAIAKDAQEEGYKDWAGAVADTVRRILCRIRKEAGDEEYKNWYKEFMREINAEDFDSIRTRVKEELMRGCGKRLGGSPEIKSKDVLPNMQEEPNPTVSQVPKDEENIVKRVENIIRSSLGGNPE